MYDYDTHEQQEALAYEEHCIRNLITSNLPDVDSDTIKIEGPHMAIWENPIKITSTIGGVRVDGYFSIAHAHLIVDRHGSQTYYISFEPRNHYLTRHTAAMLYMAMAVWAKVS